MLGSKILKIKYLMLGPTTSLTAAKNKIPNHSS